VAIESEPTSTGQTRHAGTGLGDRSGVSTGRKW
jgi:hypothetical protein